MGVGVGVWLSYYNRLQVHPAARLSVQWVVRLGEKVSLICAPFVVGQSYLDFVYNWFDMKIPFGGGRILPVGHFSPLLKSTGFGHKTCNL